jgi:hypothetical protein
MMANLRIEGVQFIIDSKGKKTGVVIDLKTHGELWEDFYDSLLARQREKEPRESLRALKNRLRRVGKS